MDDEQLIERFCDELWAQHSLSDHTLAAYRSDLFRFAEFLFERNQSLITAHSADVKDHLAQCERQAQARSSIVRRISSLRRFYRDLCHREEIDVDPMAQITQSKLPRLLSDPLTEFEVETLLSTPNMNDPVQLRDKTMLVLLYATGLRVSELVALQIDQIDLLQGTIQVIGRNGKERVMSVDQQTQQHVTLYLQQGRDLLLGAEPSKVLFPSKRGKQMTRQTFWHRVKYYALAAQITKPLSPHTLRQAFATDLLNYGTDLKVVQLLLGHSDLSTTQIYTHAAQARLTQ